ncbi:hypothetical protein IFU30_11025 [Plantibacter sp. CFBP 8798]|nr:hypothetical protein [Plantibacter sp. CFBP 8798]
MYEPWTSSSEDDVTWTVTCKLCGGEVVMELKPFDPYIMIDAMHQHPCFADHYSEADRAFVARMLEGRVIPDE